MCAIDGLLESGLVGPAREHLWHHHVTTLIDRLTQMWAKHPAPQPDMQKLYPEAWRLWFARAPDKVGKAERARRLMRAFSSDE